jgi:hypothetical protein
MCSEMVSVNVTGSLTQQNAQSQASGSFGTFVSACTPAGTRWTATATSDTRTRFSAGMRYSTLIGDWGPPLGSVRSLDADDG